MAPPEGTKPSDESEVRRPTPKPRRHGPEGDVQVYGADEQHAAPVDVGRWVELAREVLLAEGVRGEAELSLLFVDEGTIVDLNRRFMEAEGPTDVLAFPIDDPVEAGRWPDAGTAGPDREDPEPADLPLLLGDVVVCPAVAERQAPEHAGSYDDELALLVVHGVLHVLGHDHAEPDETAAMQARERDLLDRFHHRR
ncbi:MAG TPA: rRNA maturation RNase YbeY [Acidimicrobiales bacterium]|nr:rRNA maturation RNase YbeY [Acidimicrobiales bacterium]